MIMHILQCLYKKFHDINYQTRLMALITLIISLIISSITFDVFLTIQQDFIWTNNYLSEDLIALLIAKLSFVSQRSNEIEIKQLFEGIYLDIASIRYLTFLDSHGLIYCDFPEYHCKIKYFIETASILFNCKDMVGISIIRYSLFFNDQIVNISVPVLMDGNKVGSLELGLNITLNLFSWSKLVGYLSIVIFVSIWITGIILVLFNSMNILGSIYALRICIQSITDGNFSARVDLPPKGYLANLIISFNDMVECLEFYEKKNIEQLTLEKSKLETLISLIADGAILLDQELRIIFINQVALKTLNIFKHGIVGTYIYDHFPRYINEQFLPILNTMIGENSHKQHRTDTNCLLLKFNNQNSKTLRFVLTTVFDQDRSMLMGVAIIIEDLTKEVKLNEAKAQFISNVSHELRTPLFNIKSFLETLYEYNDSLSEIEKMDFLDIANQETQRLTLLVNDVLDLSRLESDFQYISDPIILSEIIPSIIQTSQLRAKYQQVILYHRICSSIVKIEAYYNLFIQVISNLLDNSLKFIQIGGRIVIKAYLIAACPMNKKSTLDKVRIQIIDEGTGIKAGDQSRIFDRFVRVENNVHTLEGTGLGLSIVKNIIEKHKSTIFVHSEIGVGSCFWFDLLLLKKKN
jgi:two-component system, OmpR family, sensor histidine kinase NblS